MREINQSSLVKAPAMILALLLNLSPTSGLTEQTEFNKAVNFVKKKEYANAAEVFLNLAEQHDYEAQYNLALLLRKGLGYPANYSEALYWVWLAELSGIKKAVKLREELTGLVPDETADIVREKVSKVLQSRIEAGERAAILQKAEFHITVVREPDYQAAYALRALGAALGIKGAIEKRDETEDELNLEDLMNAQAQAAEMFKNIDWTLQEK